MILGGKKMYIVEKANRIIDGYTEKVESKEEQGQSPLSSFKRNG